MYNVPIVSDIAQLSRPSIVFSETFSFNRPESESMSYQMASEYRPLFNTSEVEFQDPARRSHSAPPILVPIRSNFQQMSFEDHEEAVEAFTEQSREEIPQGQNPTGLWFNIRIVEEKGDSRKRLMFKNVPQYWSEATVREILDDIAPESYDHVYMPRSRTSGEHRSPKPEQSLSARNKRQKSGVLLRQLCGFGGPFGSDQGFDRKSLVRTSA